VWQGQSFHAHLNLRREYKRAKVLLLVVISLAVIVALWFSQRYLGSESRAGQTPLASHQSLLLYDKEQKEQTDLVILLEKLSDRNEDVREGSRKRIVELGQQSKGNRQIVIAELLKRVEAPDFRYQTTTLPGSLFWVEVSKIFSALKAVEAIDFLIDCLNCAAVHQYASNSYRHRPAVGALIVLGQPAVPKLVKTLSHPDPRLRFYAVVCLGSIQGDAAREALINALPNEPDLNVQAEIKGAIAAIDRGL
jgi:hypothetical protein